MDADKQPMTWTWRIEGLACVASSAHCFFFFFCLSCFWSFAMVPAAHNLCTDLCKKYVYMKIAFVSFPPNQIYIDMNYCISLSLSIEDWEQEEQNNRMELPFTYRGRFFPRFTGSKQSFSDGETTSNSCICRTKRLWKKYYHAIITTSVRSS